MFLSVFLTAHASTPRAQTGPPTGGELYRNQTSSRCGFAYVAGVSVTALQANFAPQFPKATEGCGHDTLS